MKLTLQELMENLGCNEYPKRWKDIFEQAMDEYDKNGCFLADWAYYENLNEKYGCFEEYGYVYKAAVEQIKDEEMLCRYLLLLSMSLNDKVHKKEDLKEFVRLQAPSGKEPTAYEMVSALALCSQLEGMAEDLRQKKIPEKYIRDTMRSAVNGVRNYIWRHEGAYGFYLLRWAQKYVEGKLFPIGRLEMELFATFSGKAIVFQNENGEVVSLADELPTHRNGMALGCKNLEDEEGSWVACVEEKEDAWIGYPYLENGLASKERISLLKSEWREVVRKGDPVISVHIPPTGKLTPELVDKTIAETKEFVSTYFPEFTYKAFVCESWMMSTQLEELLGGGNIVEFSKRFHRMTIKSQGEAVFDFIFLKPDMNFEIQNLPENTTLERKLKSFYLTGNVLYEMFGFFL